MVKKEVWDRQADQSGSLAWRRYKTARFEATREYIKMAVKYTGITKGVVWLMRTRIGAIWMASRAAQAKLVGPQWIGKCPSCGEASVSDLAHLLLPSGKEGASGPIDSSYSTIKSAQRVIPG